MLHKSLGFSLTNLHCCTVSSYCPASTCPHLASRGPVTHTSFPGPYSSRAYSSAHFSLTRWTSWHLNWDFGFRTISKYQFLSEKSEWEFMGAFTHCHSTVSSVGLTPSYTRTTKMTQANVSLWWRRYWEDLWWGYLPTSITVGKTHLPAILLFNWLF